MGGPIITDKLFFFGGYQGTPVRQRPASNIAFVPTPAMLAGDFTTFTSPQCNGGRQVALRAPYVNNRIDPALFSPAALNLARRLPTHDRSVRRDHLRLPADRDEKQALARIDYQTGTKHAFFGRYLVTRFTQEPGYAGGSDNVLKTSAKGTEHVVPLDDVRRDDGVQRVGRQRRCGSRSTKARWTSSRRRSSRRSDLGIKLYTYVPGYMTINVTGGFLLYDTNTAKALFLNDTYQLAEDLTVVRGNHQFGVGANMQYFKGDYTSTSRANGNWIINGSATGPRAGGPAGRPRDERRARRAQPGARQQLVHGAVRAGLVARVEPRLTLNLGVRWEPYFGQNVENNAITIFVMENFERGIKSKVFHNAPAGLIYPGDEGFPSGQTGLDMQWWNLAPRLGLAWDVHGDGRLAVRSSYAMGYDFMSGEYHNINSSAAAVRQPLDAGRSAGPDGRPVSVGRRRSPSDRDRTRHAVRAVRQLRHDGSRHQLAAGAVVERDGRAAARLRSGA